MNHIFTEDILKKAKEQILQWGSSFFTFLAGNNDKSFIRSREQLEKWFSNISDPEERNEFLARFRNENDASHLGAYFELMWNQFILEEGWSPSRHFDLPNGKNVDFFVKNEKQNFFLEIATILPPQGQQKNTRLYNSVLDNLRKIKEGYLFSVHFLKELPHNFRVADPKKFLELEFKKLTQNKPSEKYIKIKFGNPEIIEFTIYLDEQHQSMNKLTGVLYPAQSSGLGSDQVKTRLKEKAKKYSDTENMEEPLVIAICRDEASFLLQGDSVQYDLFGQPALQFNVDGSGEAIWTRDKSGFFVPKKADMSDVKNTRISAVIECRRKFEYVNGNNDFPENIYITRVFHNPWASKPLNQELFAKLPQYIPVKTETTIEMKWINDDKQNLYFPD